MVKKELLKDGKKAIYARHGIIYANGKIYHPVFGWISPMLVNGNAKLGKGVWTFSMLPTNKEFTFEYNGISHTVKGTCCCSCDGCYATKGFYNMPSVLIANGIRTIIAREFLAWLEEAIMAQIEADGIKLVRIHASGDFFCDEYVEMWKRIASNNPSVAMWTYTKVSRYEKAFDLIVNVNVVKSVIEGFGFNFGHCGYILTVYRALKQMGIQVYICRCGIDKNQHCINCKGCSENTVVLFIEHSTEYKAQEDPQYEELKAVIEAQHSMEIAA